MSEMNMFESVAKKHMWTSNKVPEFIKAQCQPFLDHLQDVRPEVRGFEDLKIAYNEIVTVGDSKGFLRRVLQLEFRTMSDECVFWSELDKGLLEIVNAGLG